METLLCSLRGVETIRQLDDLNLWGPSDYTAWSVSRGIRLACTMEEDPNLTVDKPPWCRKTAAFLPSGAAGVSPKLALAKATLVSVAKARNVFHSPEQRAKLAHDYAALASPSCMRTVLPIFARSVRVPTLTS